ncbi:MAG: calcium/sodium antiporter, partial [Rhodothermales bacterium]|nr:calcium/sodium antiporter [Rhodothermales bacterium]
LSVGGGLALLWLGAEALVRGAAALAVRFGLSPLLVGLTVVAFGTSAPELVVTAQAALDGAGGIAVGNVLGSNICNVALILGLSALVRPLRVEAQLLRLDIPLAIAVSVLVTVLLLDQEVSRVEGGGLVAGVLVYVVYSVWQGRRKRGAVPEALLEGLPRPKGMLLRDVLLVGMGLGLLAVGARALTSGAVGIAEVMGVPEAVIGLTIVALGTSMPELATSTVAAVRGAGDLAIGNVIGSNLFNLLGILGTAALIEPLWAPGIGGVDLFVMTATAALMLPLARTGHELSRGEGALLLLSYVSYLVYLVV